MDIKPLDQTVKNLLETAFYKIPRFQRPYSWDRENVEDFWNDAIVGDDPDYFIGSFVLYRAKGATDVLYVVDGQQRLTTITLLLAATRDALHNLDLRSLATGIQKLIERADINNELRFVLDSETPYPFFQEQIQKYGDGDEAGELGTEENSIKAAFDYLSGQISRAMDAIDADSTTDEKAKTKEKQKKLLHIRDKLLRLQLISVRLGNEDEAYLIFETMNTRGKDLTVSDLVKNHLTRLLKPTHKGVDIAKDKWNSILELFDKSETEINVNRFLHHSWLSRKPYTTEKKLFKEIKHIVDKKAATGFLDTLVADAKLYRQVLEPDSVKWKKEQHQIADSIRALMVFRVVQPVPMMLSLLREYHNGGVKLRRAKLVFAAMENFHVQFTAITSQRTGGGTAFMYALSARQLLEAKTADAKAKVLTEFVSKLRDRVPGYEEFEAAFGEVWFTDDNTRQRQLARYILRRIDEYQRDGDTPNYDVMTIDHLAPQNPSGTSFVSDDAMGVIGNLLLIPEEMNKQLGNQEFADKLKALKKSSIPLDPVLKGASEWNDATVESRTKALAKMCYDKVFKV